MITFNVNGKDVTVDVPPEMPLLWVLRDILAMSGTKFGCGMAQCGACTVHLDGLAVRSCITAISDVGAQKVTTIEAVSQTPVGKKVQDAWEELQVAQCGYCQPGQIMSATGLLTLTPKPTDNEILAAMAGNICRCATYVRIKEAIKHAAQV